jgi:predicted RecB family nuclease
MEKVITSEAVVGYSQCPYKAYLILCTSKRGTQHEYMQILEKQRQVAQRNYIDELREKNANVQPYRSDNLREKHKYLVNATLEAYEYSAKCAVLSKVRTHSAFGHYSYEPTIVVGSHTIKKEHRLEIFFVSHVLELVQEKRPVSGRIVGLDGKSHRVKLENGAKALIPFLEPLQEWVAEETPEPPCLILNKNCLACQFHDLCREKAVQEDSLSLLDGISTQKAINRYERKGIFTVKQLSYTFKPRKRRKRTKNPPPVLHKPELQALAIRDQKIYLQELPELTRQPVELFLDIEGVPDQQFYYLIGLLVSENDTTTYHPFWADTLDDEALIWNQFMEKVNQYPGAPIYHYGSFEPRTLKKLGRRYDSEVEDLIERLVNVNKHIYGKVYFPVYSNRLKEIGTFIGATWTAPNASGLRSLVWWYQWEKTYDVEYKNVLLVYNQEDCQALKLLTYELSKIKHSVDTMSDVDFANQPKQRATEVGEEIHNQFEMMLKFAHANYEKKKICFCQDHKSETKEEKSDWSKKGYQGQRKVKPKATKKIFYPAARSCPICGSKYIDPKNSEAKRLIIDFKLLKTGIRKTIIEHIGIMGYCKSCHKIFAPPEIRFYGPTALYGHGLKSWIIYQRVALRQSYENIAIGLLEQFNEEMPSATVGQIIRQFGNYYKDTERNLTKRLWKSLFIHVDETPVSIRGTGQYVWVFTNGEIVIFKLRSTRSSDFLDELLDGYEGVLVSDFYSGYDSIKCHQQKCWVHLIRDLNDDLWKEPFDTEFEYFVAEIKNLLLPIMETIQKYGLKKRHLNKHKKSVDEFYNQVVDEKRYKSELAVKYQKRFTRYRESLFVFLTQDGIPWHNNTAERAIRHLAKQKVTSGTFGEQMMQHYLVLLGIRQTCRFQGKSFFKFLFSGEIDLDKFEARKRRQRV